MYNPTAMRVDGADLVLTDPSIFPSLRYLEVVFKSRTNILIRLSTHVFVVLPRGFNLSSN